MKKVYLILISALFVSYSQAQTLGLDPGHNTIDLYTTNDSMVSDLHPYIMNTGTVDLNVGAWRYYQQMASGHATYFCWDECYDTTVYISPDVIEIRAGNSTELFHGYVHPGGFGGTSEVWYKFYDFDGIYTDTFVVQLTYHFSGVGINEVAKNNATLSGASPNPSHDLTSVTYSFSSAKSAQLTVRDLLGSTVKQIALSAKNGVLVIPTKDLPSGVYIYSLVLDGKASASKKLVVAHR